MFEKEEENVLKERFVVKETTIKIPVNNKDGFKEKRIALICVMNEDTGIVYPHPISSFIKNHYRDNGNSGSINSQLNPAREVVKFLNYILERVADEDPLFIELKDKGIFGLKVLHGSLYLTHKTREGSCNKDTVERIEKYLTKFYYFLKNEGIINDLEVTYKLNYNTNSNDIVSPFRHYSLHTEFPDDEFEDEDATYLLKDFGENRFPYVCELIKIARMVCPEIALGLCFQFFGGLRRGEVVNVTIDSIEPDLKRRNFFRVIVDKKQHILFPHLQNTANEGVKRRRKQTLLANNLLYEVYEEHMKRLKSTPSLNPKALFVSPKTKLPISGASYAEKFIKVKSVFLQRLLEKGRLDEFDELNVQWSTHIGRGVFTNFLLGIGLNPTQVAIARGDKNINSVLAYIEKRNLETNMTFALKEIEKSWKIGNAEIDSKRVVSWKEFSNAAARVGGY